MWRYHWSEEKDGDRIKRRRRPEALVMSEALTRANPADEDERDALIELFTAIEAGAITGANVGFESREERQQEEEGSHG